MSSQQQRRESSDAQAAAAAPSLPCSHCGWSAAAAAGLLVGETKPVDSQQAFPVDRLIPYLAQHLPTFSSLHSTQGLAISQFTHGQSNPTFLLSLGDSAFVLRKQPKGALLSSAHQIHREFAVMKALYGSLVPVPRVHCLCEDSGVIGQPFYVMQYVQGRIFKQADLPLMTRDARFAVYSAMNSVLAALHAVDVKHIGLQGFGPSSGYAQRSVERWSRQYEASKTEDIRSMDRLTAWLRSHMQGADDAAGGVCIVHGDFRLDNLVFHPTQNRIIAVLDWELATLGSPIADIAYNCLPYHIPREERQTGGDVGTARPRSAVGKAERDRRGLGIPSEADYLQAYTRNSLRQGPLTHYRFYLALAHFRLASICQGVFKRAQQGNAASTNAQVYGALVHRLSQRGVNIAEQTEERDGLFPALTHPIPSASFSFQRFAARYPFPYSPALQPLLTRLLQFMELLVYPNEATFAAQHAALSAAAGSPWVVPPVLEELKAKARSLGLWNLFLTQSPLRPAALCSPLNNVSYAVLCEVLGRSPLLAPEACNCSAPDTGNMEVLANYGSEEQRRRWLQPLMAGEIRSAFAMTEPAVGSSDATQVECSIERDGDELVVNGRKWWTSGAMDPRCQLLIVMGKTDSAAPRHRQQSMLLVPVPCPGLSIVRHLTVFGNDDSPHGHAELSFVNCRVPASNLIFGPGRGFEIAQGRLGGGRVHHCMRLIGMAERALEMTLSRALTREAFGGALARKGGVLADIADSRMRLEQSRLLVLQAAAIMDAEHSAKGAMQQIAAIKAVVPNMALTVIDRAIQVHGAKGVSQDTILPTLWIAARTLRLADGPDEVHIEQIAKLELKKARL